MDYPTVDDRLGNEVLKSSDRLKQEVNNEQKACLSFDILLTVKFINTATIDIDLIVTVVYKDNQNNEQKELLC